MVELQSIVHRLTHPHDGGGGVLASLVKAEGSSYRRPGARLLITPDGTRIGSISGGCLEEDLIARASQVAATGSAELVVYDTTSENDLVWGVGLGCNGVVRVLLERLPPVPLWASMLAAQFQSHRATELRVIWESSERSLLGTHLRTDLSHVPADAEIFDDLVHPPTRLVILGAGDDAKPLAKMAKGLGWHVTIGDPRAEFATRSRFPDADEVAVAPAAQLVDRIGPPPDALAVVMTHHYVHDVPLLADLLPRCLPYLGLLGPKKRAAKILSDIQSQGHAFTSAQLQRLHAPVGFDLGAETPEEVALSIVSEMRAILAQRDGRPLRDRDRPIHD